MKQRPSNAQYQEAARRLFHKDGEIEVDEKAPVSLSDGNPDKGAYVQAWVWVADVDARSKK